MTKPTIMFKIKPAIMFKIKSYSKAELAMLYFPDSDPHVAVNHLMRWIYKCKPLMDDLNKTGYRKQAKYLLTQQVRMVVEHLGEPWFEFWVLNFEFWIVAALPQLGIFQLWIFNTNELFWTRIIIFWTRITRITRIFFDWKYCEAINIRIIRVIRVQKK